MNNKVFLLVIALAAGLFEASVTHAQVAADTLQDIRPFGTHALEQLAARETGGLRASLGWNRWQLTVSGHGDAGQTILHVDYSDALYRYYMEHSPESISWIRSENCILSASFFRLDQVRLDYTLPLRSSARLNLFASLENGFLLTKYPGSDPELALAWNGLGVETAAYPSTRRTVFGLRIGF